jgi:CRISPR-associated protein Cas2
MVILILERVPTGLRGELSRWMIEPRTGVFVGVMSGLVRDKLWEKVQKNAAGGGAVLIHSARTEQGFRLRTSGDPSRQPIDMEGLMLIRIPHRPRQPGNRGLGTDSERDDEAPENANE